MKKEVVNVRSQEELDYVTEKLGYDFGKFTKWNKYKKETCINLNEQGFAYIDFYKSEEYNVISLDEFKQRYEPKETKLLVSKTELIKQYVPKEHWKDFGIEEEIVLRDLEELDFKGTYYPTHGGKITNNDEKFDYMSLNVPTEKHAKSMLAYAKLSMLMADLGEECNVDWGNLSSDKYCIRRTKKILVKEKFQSHYQFLAFKTEKIRDLFFDKHCDLIKDYFML